MCLDRGITPVSMSGTLVKEMVTLDKNGRSGLVTSLNRSLPRSLVSSALISMGALSFVLNRMAMPGGAEVARRLWASEATGFAWKPKETSPNYQKAVTSQDICNRIFLLKYQGFLWLSRHWREDTDPVKAPDVSKRER